MKTAVVWLMCTATALSEKLVSSGSVNSASGLGWNLGLGSDTCADIGCGTYDSSASCQCDSDCQSNNNCCTDFVDQCLSCSTLGCSFNSKNLCQCNSACVGHGDCCDDYEAACGGSSGGAVECATAPATAGDRRDDKTRLRVLEFNAEWLFTDDSHSIGSITCPGSCEWPDDATAWEHLNTVAAYLNRFDADIIIMPEIEDCTVLGQLIDVMGAEGENYKPYVKLGIDTATGQQVGLVTKIDPVDDLIRNAEYVSYPVPGSECGYTGSKTTSCSKHFKTRFNIENLGYLSLVGLHLIAYPTDVARCAKREAQATIIADTLASAVDAGDYIIVTGDFNDYDDSVKDAYGNVPLSKTTEIIRNVATPPLINVANGISTQDQRYSSWWDVNSNCVDNGGQEHSLIDHLLLSDALYQQITNVYIDHSFDNFCGCLYSDHWPTIVDFDLSQTRSNGAALSDDSVDDTDDPNDDSWISSVIDSVTKLFKSIL